VRTRARTARLFALTHLSPTFGPGMGRPDRACLFVSARWVTIYLFFYLRGRVRTQGGRLRRCWRCPNQLRALARWFLSAHMFLSGR
jgi:hypothetical protein